MKLTLDRVENNGKVMPKHILDRAIILTKASMEDWTREDLEAYVFDRLANEIAMRLLGECDE